MECPNVAQTSKFALGVGIGFFHHRYALPIALHVFKKIFGAARTEILLNTKVEIPFTIKLLMFPLFCVVIPIAEELVFRQGLQPFLKEVFDPAPSHLSQMIATIKAIAVTSLIFGVYHFSNYFVGMPLDLVILQVIATTVAGITLGVLKECVGLEACLGMHLTNNLVCWVGLCKPELINFSQRVHNYFRRVS